MHPLSLHPKKLWVNVLSLGALTQILHPFHIIAQLTGGMFSYTTKVPYFLFFILIALTAAVVRTILLLKSPKEKLGHLLKNKEGCQAAYLQTLHPENSTLQNLSKSLFNNPDRPKIIHQLNESAQTILQKKKIIQRTEKKLEALQLKLKKAEASGTSDLRTLRNLQKEKEKLTYQISNSKRISKNAWDNIEKITTPPPLRIQKGEYASSPKEAIKSLPLLSQ